jgi:hypothetical protein
VNTRECGFRSLNSVQRVRRIDFSVRSGECLARPERFKANPGWVGTAKANNAIAWQPSRAGNRPVSNLENCDPFRRIIREGTMRF